MIVAFPDEKEGRRVGPFLHLRAGFWGRFPTGADYTYKKPDTLQQYW
jgi:hypothetical protein